MTRRLEDHVVLVTGGLSGIGAAICSKLVSEGAKVIAGDLSTTATTLSDAAISPLHLDVSDQTSVDSAIKTIVDHHGRLDGLVNSAGVAREQPFLDTPVEAFDAIIAVNLRGSFLVGQAAARAMKAGGGGAIINIASVSGVLGNAGRSAYGASKGGVITLSKVMAVDLAQFGIRVNVIAPGPVETPLVAQVHSADTREEWGRRVPLKRYGSPDEMAGAAVFLLSDEASYVTGHVLTVDGGFLAQGLAAPPAA
ncbi:MAG: 3-oxoacyl-ACP reductase FabG [Caulobacteraceae bacterium]|nr:MAG: 3-oxoacyl-ACP reductase FabG [Caulobacteraceae bacterium]